MSENEVSHAPKTGNALSRSLLGWYGLGAAPGGIALTTGTFLVFYYNQILGVAGATVGLALLIASIFDAVTDPIAGAISDRTRSRFGRRHPYLFACAIPLGIVFYLIWVPPGFLGSGGLVIWLVFWLLIQRLLTTFHTVPYLALGAELTHDYNERTKLTTARSYFSNFGRSIAGAMLLLVFLRPTAEYPNGQHNPAGYPPFAMTFALVTVLLVGISAWKTLSEGQSLTQPSGRRLSWKATLIAPLRDIRDALRYRPFRSITFCVLVQNSAYGVSDALGMYMTTFFWGVSNQWFFLWGIGMFSGIFIGFEFWRKIGLRLEKRRIYIIGSLGYLASYIIPYVLKVLGWWPQSESWLYIPLYIATTGFVAHFFIAGPAIMTGSMLGDITDLDELESGKRREGVIFGAESLAFKMFVGLGPVIAGYVVDFAGIVPNMQPSEVSERTIVFLGLGQGVTSAILFTVSLMFIVRYDLTRDRHKSILKGLQGRLSH
ncbi:MAG: hypothetical protein GY866_02830 [Proteobacteria bacterium]|nr:hypothetical protein [Pseudomonadota bacterium]